MIIREELKVRVKYNIKVNSKEERVKYTNYFVSFPIEYSKDLENKELKSLMIVSNEDKAELKKVKLFSMEYCKRMRRKCLIIVPSSLRR
jgi:hypothetical protein